MTADNQGSVTNARRGKRVTHNGLASHLGEEQFSFRFSASLVLPS